MNTATSVLPVPERRLRGHSEDKTTFIRQNFQYCPVPLGLIHSATERIAADHNRTAATPLAPHELLILQSRINSAWTPAEKVRVDYPATPTSQNVRHAGRFINLF